MSKKSRRSKKDIRETKSAIDKYLQAFEEGTMPPDTCGPRIRELGELLESLEVRKANLESEEIVDCDPLSLEDVQHAAENLIGLLEQFKTEDASELKNLLSKLVPEIEVESRERVFPAIHLSLVFIMDSWVPNCTQ